MKFARVSIRRDWAVQWERSGVRRRRPTGHRFSDGGSIRQAVLVILNRRWLLGLLVALALSCGCSSPTSPSSTLANVSITDIQTSSLSRIGETERLEATARFADGTTQTVPATWQSSNPSVATVSGGLVTAVAAGTVTISATVSGKTATTNITVAPGANGMTATIDGMAFTPVDVGGVLEARGSLHVWGINDVSDLEIGVPATVGTYQLNGPTTGYVFLLAVHRVGEWDSDVPGGSGTVTVSTLTSTAASGTFSVTLASAVGPPTDTKLVTNGTFNVTF